MLIYIKQTNIDVHISIQAHLKNIKMSKVYYPLYGPPTSSPTITTEELYGFHAIDRALYALLIFTLGRDPAESMRVVGFLLWIERNWRRGSSVVQRMLLMRASVVNSVAEESVACLKCVESDGFCLDPVRNDIPWLRILARRRDLSLRFFHDNRVSVLRGVTQIVSEVCARAFEDIITHVLGNRNPFFMGSSSGGGVAVGTGGGVVAGTSGGGGGGGGNGRSTILGSGEGIRVVGVPFYPGVGVVSHMGYGGLTGNVAQWPAPFMAASSTPHGLSWADENIGVANCQMAPANEPMRFSNDEMESMGSQSLPQGGGGGGGGGGILQEEESELVPPDDRTIFLTFSKGYPISENEVKEFFTRKYGEIFEGLHMQEVAEDEQALFARLVARSASGIGVVLGGQRKARFSINGKHVWARKYIKKHPKSPFRITTTASTATTTTEPPPAAAATAAPRPLV